MASLAFVLGDSPENFANPSYIRATSKGNARHVMLTLVEMDLVIVLVRFIRCPTAVHVTQGFRELTVARISTNVRTVVCVTMEHVLTKKEDSSVR